MTSESGGHADEQVSGRQFRDADGVDDWRLLWGGGWASAYFVTGSFERGAALVARIAELATGLQQAPDVELRAEGVTVRVCSGPWGPITRRDVELAGAISVAARELGLAADPSRVQQVQLSIDAAVIDSCRPFWAAVLGYDEAGDEDVLDPLRRGPTVTFQQMDPARTDRNRLHVDVYLPYDQVQARIEAALAAGGHVVSEANAPYWWTLADPEGNEVDLAIWGSG